MIKKVLVIFLLALALIIKVSAQEYRSIEIFDIHTECVVKKLPSNVTLQKEVDNYLKGITGIYVKLNPIPKKGFMVKIPLDPDLRIQNQWFQGLVNEVIVIFPEEGEPYLMVFDSMDRPHIFYFEGQTDILLKKMNYPQTAPAIAG